MEEVTPIDNINSIVNLNENNGAFATGIDYIGGNKSEKEITLPLIKKQTPPKPEEPKTEKILIKVQLFLKFLHLNMTQIIFLSASL